VCTLKENADPSAPLDTDQAYKTTMNALHTYYKENFYDYYRQTHHKALKVWKTNCKHAEIDMINGPMGLFSKRYSHNSSNLEFPNEDAGCSVGMG
jgi:hypothetical protein